MGEGELSLIEAEIKSIARGNVFGEPEPWKREAAAFYNSLQTAADVALWVVVLAILALGLYAARRKVAASSAPATGSSASSPG